MREELVLQGAGVALEAIADWQTRPAPAVILLAGWGGSAADMTKPAEELHDHGFTALALTLRGFGGSEGADDCGGQQVDDVVEVARWLLAPGRATGASVAVLGLSHGGQVALLAAAATPLIGQVAAWKPVTDVARWRETTEHPDIPAYIDAVCGPDLARRSPVSAAASMTGPVLLVHGDADTRVPTEQSLLMHRALLAAGKEVELLLLPGLGHRLGPEGNRPAMDRTMAFFLANLRRP
ncbi:MAG: alpha/beta fold hydrolase [Acidimicrobiia bacterium]|nr:alpha/beta fold hydrolase [Acidimicrobiia bacterium]